MLLYYQLESTIKNKNQGLADIFKKIDIISTYMGRYYHCLPAEDVQSVLKEGIKPGIKIGRQTFYRGIPTDNNYLYLWKKLDILEGKLYNELVSDGIEFLSVDIPVDYPIERDLDAKVLVLGSPEVVPYLWKALQVRLNPGEFISKETLQGYINTLYPLPKEERKDKLAQLIFNDLVDNPEAIFAVIERASVERWDEVIGFYRTSQAILPKEQYKIELFSQ